MGATTLNSIINQYIIRKKETDNSNRDYYVNLAALIIKQLHVYADNRYKARILEVNPDTNTAQLPRDFVDYGLVAACINGKMYTLDYRRDLCIAEPETVCDEQGNLVSETDRLAALNSGSDTCVYSDSFCLYGVMRGDECMENFFAIGAGFPSLGLFTINEEKTRIHLNGVSASEVVILYKSNGLEKVDCDVFIDEMYEPAIVAGLRYQEALDNPEKGALQFKKIEWETQYNQLKYARHSMTLAELIKSSRKRVGVGILHR